MIQLNYPHLYSEEKGGVGLFGLKRVVMCWVSLFISCCCKLEI